MVAASDLFELHSLRDDIAELSSTVPAAVQTRMLLEARKLGERGARWLLRSRMEGSLDEVIARYADGVKTLIDALPAMLVGTEKEAFDSLVSELTAAGVPDDIARRVGAFDELLGALDCVECAQGTGQPIEEVAAVRFQLEDQLSLRWLMDQVVALPRENRWQSLARLSLREDLHTQITRLTGVVVGSTPTDVPARQRVRRWINQNKAGVARLRHVLADIRATGTVDLATLSVGLREVTQLP